MKAKTTIKIILINLKILLLKIFRPKKVVPYKVLINLTDLCNSRCNFCDIWKIKPENEINLDEIKKSFQGLENDIYWISLTGGEVTLVNYYYELIDYFVENLKNLSIIAFTTNALAPSKAFRYAKYAKDKGLDLLITISLDGDEKLHDEVRGVKGNYAKCFELKKKLDVEGINSNFGFTVSDQSYNFVKNNTQKFEKNIKAITFVHSEGIYNKENSYSGDDSILNSLKLIYKNYKINKLHEIIEYIHIKISIIFLKNKRKKNIIPCDVLNTSFHMMPNGDIKPCMFMEKLGNIRENKITEILQNEKTASSRKIILENKCPKCWMNCYSPHSIMQNPIKSLIKLIS